MKRGKKVILKILLIVAVILAAFILFFLFYYNKAHDEALEIVDEMEEVDGDYYFYGDSDVGFIIFNGAKADERGYAYIAKLLHDAGHTAVLPKAKFHMSSFETDHGLEIMRSNPQIKKWILIGHSLGGLPVGQIAAQEPEGLVGVAFLASYMNVDLSETDLSAIRITAELDGVMNRERMEQHLDYLPERSTSVMLEGANHRGFGAYGWISFEQEASITWMEQQETSVELILDFFSDEIASSDGKE